MEKQYELSFSWKKPEMGYIWKNCEVFKDIYKFKMDIPKGPYLVERDYSQNFQSWKPLEDPTTFAVFADIPQNNADALCDWSNEHGRLVKYEVLSYGIPLYVLLSNLEYEGAESNQDPNKHYFPKRTIVSRLGGYAIGTHDPQYFPQEAESQAFWIKEHAALSFAAMVWEFVANNDLERLNNIIHWENDKTAFVLKAPRNKIDEAVDGKYCLKTASVLKALSNKIDEVVAGITFKSGSPTDVDSEKLFDTERDFRPWVSQLFSYPDVIGPARLFVQVEINRKLREFPVQISLAMNDQGERVERICPTSLLSAMWYQLYLALTGEISIRRCAICGKWENMRATGRYSNWRKHKKCISYERLKKSKLLRDKRPGRA